MLQEFKTVRFDETRNKMFRMCTCTAHREARKGRWQQDVLDRMRFQRRVADVEVVLGYVFNLEHRLRTYSDRFKNFS